MIQTLSNIFSYLLSFRFPYIYSLDFLYGTAKFVLHNKTEEFRIRKWGGEKEYTNYLITNLKPTDTFIDVGSSIGLVTVLAAIKLKKGIVVSFEPDKEIYDVLLKNILKNKLNNCKVFNLALTNNNGRMKLFTEGSDNKSPSLKPVQGFKKFKIIKTRSLDSILKDITINKIDAIKIDVEGAEYNVLRGMSKLMSGNRKPKQIFIEIHPQFLRDFGSDSDKVISYIQAKGYKIKKSITHPSQMLFHFIS